MKKNCLFSVREILLNGLEPRDQIKECFTKAKIFLDTISITERLSLIMRNVENRHIVENAIADIVHVGFIIPNHELTLIDIGEAAREAGFGSKQSTCVSTVVARELAELQAISHVPTTIFTAYADNTSRYVEIFIPEVEKKVVRKWVDAGAVTHIGLTLAVPKDYMSVQNAFLEEGFEVPLFMRGKRMVNVHKGCTLTYYDKLFGEDHLRIEIIISENGSHR